MGLSSPRMHCKALRESDLDAEHLARHYSYPTRMLDAVETREMIGADYPGAKLDMGGGHLHPLRYARGLARGVEAAGAVLFEHSRARTIETWTAIALSSVATVAR